MLEPEEGGVYDGAWADDGLRYVALPRVAADLDASPGRRRHRPRRTPTHGRRPAAVHRRPRPTARARRSPS